MNAEPPIASFLNAMLTSGGPVNAIVWLSKHRADYHVPLTLQATGCNRDTLVAARWCPAIGVDSTAHCFPVASLDTGHGHRGLADWVCGFGDRAVARAAAALCCGRGVVSWRAPRPFAHRDHGRTVRSRGDAVV